MTGSAENEFQTAGGDHAELLSDLAIRSKAVWDYPDEQLAVFRRELTFAPETLDENPATMLVSDDGIVGFYTTRRLDDVCVELEHLFIEPDQLHRGHGTSLFNHAVQSTRQTGFRRMVIQSDPNAAGFYERWGATLARQIPTSIPGRTLPLFQVALDDRVPIVVRADRSHLDAIVPLFDAYRRSYGQSGDMAGAMRFLSERIEQSDSVILVAIVQGRAVGFTQLYPSFSSVGMQRVWILNDLFVDPDSRRRGVARELLRTARNFAAETGAIRLSLATAADNAAAQTLYESEGWERDAFVHYNKAPEQ